MPSARFSGTPSKMAATSSASPAEAPALGRREVLLLAGRGGVQLRRARHVGGVRYEAVQPTADQDVEDGADGQPAAGQQRTTCLVGVEEQLEGQCGDQRPGREREHDGDQPLRQPQPHPQHRAEHQCQRCDDPEDCRLQHADSILRPDAVSRSPRPVPAPRTMVPVAGRVIGPTMTA